MIIKTKRLILRPPKLSDWKDMVEACNDFKAARMNSTSFPYRKKDAIKSVNKDIKNWKSKKKKAYSWVIELKSEKKVIGKTGIFDFDEEHVNAETGSWINRKYWKKGYITEAKMPIIDFAFNKLKLRKLISLAFTNNKGSNALSKKLGYKLEGRLRKHEKCPATRKIHDENIYGLLKEDWKKVKPRLVKKLKKKLI